MSPGPLACAWAEYVDSMYGVDKIKKGFGESRVVVGQRPEQGLSLESQRALGSQTRLGWERRGKLGCRESPGPGLREEGPLGKFTYMLPSCDIFCFVSENSGSCQSVCLIL